MLFLMLDDINTLYDNSKPFSTFLMKEGLEFILRDTKLGLREKHTIVPHNVPIFSLYTLLFRLADLYYSYSVKWHLCERQQMHCPSFPMTAGIIVCCEILVQEFNKFYSHLFVIID